MKNLSSIALLLLLCLATSLVQAEPRAWLDRTEAVLGDTITLNIETDANGEPDFTALENDFRIAGRSSSSNFNFSNGQSQRSTLWALALEPLREGTLTIAPFKIGSASTQALTLTVSAAPASATTRAGDDVFLEVEMEPASAYVQQQVLYTIRLFYAVNLLEGQIDEPQVSDAVVRRLGQDTQTTRILDNRRYAMVERRYLLTPQQSGALKIPGPRFKGRVARPGSYGSMFDPGSTTTVRGEEQVLTVQPAPANAPSPWLPATSVTFNDDATTLPETLRIGEPVTIAAELSAEGVTAEQLPELSMPSLDGAQIYPDQETAQTQDLPNTTKAVRTRKFALVPTRAGMLELPQRTVAWWNVNTGKAQRVTLPARQFKVLAASGTAADSPSPTQAAASPETANLNAPMSGNLRLWQTAAIAFALLWLLTLMAWKRAPRAVSTPSKGEETPSPAKSKPGAWRNELQHALARDDLSAARAALLRSVPGVSGLWELAEKLADTQQRDALIALERALYRGQSRDGLAQRLRDAFAKGIALVGDERKSVEKDEGLPPLYR